MEEDQKCEKCIDKKFNISFEHEGKLYCVNCWNCGDKKCVGKICTKWWFLMDKPKCIESGIVVSGFDN